MATKELENEAEAKAAANKEIPTESLGQHYPRQNPRPEVSYSPLGPPLSIAQVASLLGCSVWTVRNALIPKGLPHFRSGPSGRLVFFTNQVVRWIEQKQKGGFRS